MNCESYLELLSGHLDGENTSEQERALEAHLQKCPACRARLAAMRENDEILREPRETFPAPQLEHLGARKSRRMPPMRRLWTGAATIAAVLALVFFVGRGLLPDAQDRTFSPNGDMDNVDEVPGELLEAPGLTGTNRDDADGMNGADAERPAQSGPSFIDSTEQTNLPPVTSELATEPPFVQMSSSSGELSCELPEALRMTDIPMLLVYGLPQEEIPLGDCDLWSDFAPTEQFRVYKVSRATAKKLETKFACVANLEVHIDPNSQITEAWLVVFVLK